MDIGPERCPGVLGQQRSGNTRAVDGDFLCPGTCYYFKGFLCLCGCLCGQQCKHGEAGGEEGSFHEIGYGLDKSNSIDLVLNLQHRCTLFGLFEGKLRGRQWYTMGIRKWL